MLINEEVYIISLTVVDDPSDDVVVVEAVVEVVVVEVAVVEVVEVEEIVVVVGIVEDENSRIEEPVFVARMACAVWNVDEALGIGCEVILEDDCIFCLGFPDSLLGK